ncbi:MAG: UvrD-helicase domain-containing protein [Lysobacter sp.]|nr:UvrD-helicase domain-containing protein [Lysobacter sp.]
MTALDTQPPDPYATLALDGLQLIEASAGTGKTYTLATLVLRCVIERGMRLQEILAVTFTEAATQELRKRLRERITLAAQIAGESMAGNGAFNEEAQPSSRRTPGPNSNSRFSPLGPGIRRDDEPGFTRHIPEATPRADENPERAATRALITARLQHETPASLRARLFRAAHDIDLAAVFTIHGFCARALAEHALESERCFIGATQLTNDTALREQVATDLWREFGRDEVQAQALSRWWPQGPQQLARALRDLLRVPRLLPPLAAAVDDPTLRWRQAADHLRDVLLREGVATKNVVDAAMTSKSLSGTSYKRPTLEALWSRLTDWSGDSSTRAPPRDKLELLTPDKLARCTNKGKTTPRSPLFAAVAAYLDADAERDAWLESRHIAVLHRMRDAAATRLAKQKTAQQWQTFDDLIDGVADALDGAQGYLLAERLRAQYAIALVDEFQDTDARQWKIFQRVFGTQASATNGLFLIGDPKQAIYRFRGGDVHTYLAARRDAVQAPPLARNFRSRPSLLRALDTLYAQAGDDALVDPRIRYQPLQAGGGIDDAHFERDGATATALTIRVLPPPRADALAGGASTPTSASVQPAVPSKATSAPAAWSASESRRIATDACVADIHALLRDAQAGLAQLTVKEGNTTRTHAVRPGDIAVLVRSHAEAERIRDALTLAGVPAVAAGKQSLFQSEQAQDVLALLEALLRLDDDSRLRAALATPWLGFDALAIDRLDHDDAWRQQWQSAAQSWRLRWLRHGPLPLISDLCADNAARLLTLQDGERRLTNLLQLGEQLQATEAQTPGASAQVDGLRRRIAEADGHDETQQLRLESDAHRVRILTLHKSKGLEFPLVYLPFVGIGRSSKSGAYVEYQHEDGERVLHYKTAHGCDGVLPWDDAKSCAAHEDRAEDARLLYVGLTRAQHALWLACGPLYESAKTPLQPMLADLQALESAAPDAIRIDASPLPTTALPPLPQSMPAHAPHARQVTRTLPRDWWIHSFSQWHGALPRADAVRERSIGMAEAGAADEPEPPALTPQQLRYSGTRFGNALHAALEHTDFAAWRGHAVPPDARDALVAALREQGYPDSELDDGVALLTRLVADTLNARLPERVCLSELPAQSRRAELEFHFTLVSASSDTLLQLLHAHGIAQQRTGFGLHRRLEGLMTGLIDLVYQHDGRWYVLDYKSNQLPAYDAAALEAAMQHSEYLLQALIYTLALHRWLRFRLGGAYDYARDFGGIRYLFCRGLVRSFDPSTGSGLRAHHERTEDGSEDSEGIYARRFDVELINSLDRLFTGAAA